MRGLCLEVDAFHATDRSDTFKSGNKVKKSPLFSDKFR